MLYRGQQQMLDGSSLSGAFLPTEAAGGESRVDLAPKSRQANALVASLVPTVPSWPCDHSPVCCGHFISHTEADLSVESPLVQDDSQHRACTGLSLPHRQ
jgi:hypothetical protein